MINGTKTVVTSIYELTYIDERGKMVYKSFPLLSETIRSIIFEEYNYVIYTNKHTFEKHKLSKVFLQPNVTIKFKELGSPAFKDIVTPIRKTANAGGEIWDRIYSVEDYAEVLLNKLEMLLEESTTEGEGSVVWLDAGLFGTSCHDGWRDYMKDNLVYRKEFLDKIFEKIDEFKFIALKGNSININYEIEERINKIAGSSLKLIPGGLFGGTKSKILDVFKDYLKVYLDYTQTYNHLVTDQEILAILTANKDVKFYEFQDWTDFQRGILQILDKYDKSKYQTEKCYE
jgi:hypothetical protein